MKKIFLGCLLFFLLVSLAVLLAQSNRAHVYAASGNLGVGDTGPMPTSTPTPTPLPDVIAPTVVITNPQNGQQVNKNQVTTITATATDNVSVTQVQFFVNNVLLCTDTVAPYACNWLVPKKPNVTYTLKAEAQDPSNNIGSHSITVTSH